VERFPLVAVGATVPSLGKTPSLYTIVAVTPKGFTLSRANGTQAKVSLASLLRCSALLEQGERKFQGNFNAGGIDGTSMIRDGIMFALGAIKDGSSVRLVTQADRDVA